MKFKLALIATYLLILGCEKQQQGSQFNDFWSNLNTGNLTGAIDAITRPPTETYCQDCSEQVSGPPSSNQEIHETSNQNFKNGCEVLARDLTPASKSSLNVCLESILREITRGAVGSNGKIKRGQMFCNMYSRLRPEEQHFAGMIFTSVGEAGSITKSSKTSSPRYQEQIFVMKTMDNRLRRLRERSGNQNTNALDIALANKQFSMYNSNIFSGSNYQKLFTPGDRAHSPDKQYAIDAFIAFQSNPEKLAPPGEADLVDMYYNPHGMEKISNRPVGEREALRNRVQTLKAQGKIPADHPLDRIAPSWDFSKLEPVENFSYDGVKARSAPPLKHTFYRKKRSQDIYYGNTKHVPPPWRRGEQCSAS